MDFSDEEGSKKRPRSEEGDDNGEHDENEHQTSKSRGTVTVQIFIKSTLLLRCKGFLLPATTKF